MGPLSALADIAAEWAVEVAAAIGSGIVGLFGYVRRVDTRSRQNKRQLQGDPDDPNHEGVLQISKENGEKIDNLSGRIDEILKHLDEMNGDG